MTEPIKLAGFNADFAQTKRFKYEIEPAAEIGFPITLLIYSPDVITIDNPYGGYSLGEPQVSEQKTEILVIGASPQYPIKQVISRRTSNPIVDIDDYAVTVSENTAIEEDFNDNEADLVGSIELEYLTFDAQVFNLDSLGFPGEYIVWAIDENGCKFEIKFTLSEKNDSKSYQITLEGHDRTLEINKYALRLFPADNDILVKASCGLIEETTGEQVYIRETVSFNNSSKQAASHTIEALIFAGADFFLDENYDFVTAAISVSEDGELELSRKATGVVAIAYYTSVRLFNITPLVDGLTTHYPTIVAFNKEQKVFATFNVPLPGQGESNREDMIIIYREVIVQGAKIFEIPDGAPAWPDGNSYLSYGGAPVDDKPVIGDAYAIQQDNHHIVFVENSAMFDDLPTVFWNAPAVGDPFNGVVYKIKSSIPSSPTETIDAALITRLQARELELKAQYGIA